MLTTVRHTCVSNGPMSDHAKQNTSDFNIIINYLLTWFRFFKDVMQSARKSGQDGNIDDFLGYIEIPVKVQNKNRETFIDNTYKSMQNVSLLKIRRKPSKNNVSVTPFYKLC